MFDLFDQDRNGVVTTQEIIETFKELKLPISQEYATKLIEEFDQNGDGELEFSEFVGLMRKYMKVKNYPTEGMFMYFDLDGDGYISLQEFVKSMRCLGIDMTVEGAERLLDDYYTNRGVKLSYANFDEMMRQHL